MERRAFILEADAPCLDGHFPGRPVIPGVVLIEAALAAFGLVPPLRIEQAKFLRPCAPGMALELVMSPTGAGADLRIEHAGEVVAAVRVRPAADGAAADADV